MPTVANVEQLCRIAGIPCTKRQRRKHANGRGISARAEHLGLLSLESDLLDARRSVSEQKAYIGKIDSELDLDLWIEVMFQLDRLEESAEEAENLLDYTKRLLPKYSPHITKK